MKRPSLAGIVKTFVAVAISGACLYFSARNLEFSKVLSDMQSMQPGYVLLSVVFLVIAITIRAYRWHLVVQREKTFPFSNTFWATFIGYLGNNILPARAGEVMRSVVLGLSAGIRKSLLFSTAITERALDAGVLLILAFTMLQYTVELPESVRKTWAVIFPVVLIILVVAFLAPLMQTFWLALIDRLPFLGENIKARLKNLLIGLLDGVRVFYNWKLMLSFVLISFSVWLIDATGYVIMAKAFDADLTLPQATVFIAALGFASSIPSTPGYVGVFQAIAVLILPVFGMTTHKAFLLVSLFQVILLLVTVFFGGIGWVIMQKRIGVARLEQELAQAD